MRAATVILVLIAAMLVAQTVLANWYTGNSRTSAYGIKADIYTPSSAPYLAADGESNWVSIPTPDWVQTGWYYRVGFSSAKPYVEHQVGQNYGLTDYGTQSWNTSKNYKVEYSSANNTWRAYIDNDFKEGWGPISAPKTVLGRSEVHTSSSNELDTDFDNVYWKNSLGSWNLFDQDNFVEQSPYDVEETQYYKYRCYGP